MSMLLMDAIHCTWSQSMKSSNLQSIQQEWSGAQRRHNGKSDFDASEIYTAQDMPYRQMESQ